PYRPPLHDALPISEGPAHCGRPAQASELKSRLPLLGRRGVHALVPRAGAFRFAGPSPTPDAAGALAPGKGRPAQERRPMARAEKVAAVAELTERFQSSSGAV